MIETNPWWLFMALVFVSIGSVTTGYIGHSCPETCDEDYCLEKGWTTRNDNVPACDSCCMPLLGNESGIGFANDDVSVYEVITSAIKLQKTQCKDNEIVGAETVFMNGEEQGLFKCVKIQQNSTSQVIERVIDTCPTKKCYCTLGGTGHLVTPNLTVSGVQ